MKTLPTKTMLLADLKPHPRNYREHPEDQLLHIIKSIEEHGFYRNIVIAKDNTILAGHGVVKASLQMGLKEAPVIKLDIDSESPKALKVLAGDNELGKLAEVNDRVLSELLKEIMSKDVEGLLGTGFDEMMLSNLVMTTRPASEIKNINEAAEWLGMPDYEPTQVPYKISINFRSAEDRTDFIHRFDMGIADSQSATIATWYPPKEREDKASVRYD
jgi:hypothetical protein